MLFSKEILPRIDVLIREVIQMKNRAVSSVG